MLLASSGFAAWAGIVARGRRTVPGHRGVCVADVRDGVLGRHERTARGRSVVRRPRRARPAAVHRHRAGRAALVDLHEPIRAQPMAQRPPAAGAALGRFRSSPSSWRSPIAWHHLLWTDIRPVDGGLRLEYIHGPWFWVAVLYNYAALATGTVCLIRALRHFPVPVSPANGVHDGGRAAAMALQRRVCAATAPAGHRHHADRLRRVRRVVRVGLLPPSPVRPGSDRARSGHRQHGRRRHRARSPSPHRRSQSAPPSI